MVHKYLNMNLFLGREERILMYKKVGRSALPLVARVTKETVIN